MTPFTEALARYRAALATYVASSSPRDLMLLEDALVELRRAHEPTLAASLARGEKARAP